MLARAIVSKYDIVLECMVNEDFQHRLNELWDFARRRSKELKNPELRLFQIEESLSRHLAKIVRETMKKLIILLVIGLAAWQLYGKYQGQTEENTLTASTPTLSQPKSSITNTVVNNFRCDGRTHCSQMTSCEEATWFLKNCPGTKMDGNHDGVPCERQWCK